MGMYKGDLLDKMRKFAEITDKTSEKIRALCFLCALFVVPIHCMTINISGNYSKVWESVHVVLSATIVRVAVPFFFVVSGFFMFYKCSPDIRWWRECIWRRLKTLFLPYLLWNMIYYVLRLVTGKYTFDFYDALGLILGLPLGGDLACGQFWYIRCIFIYALVAPIFLCFRFDMSAAIIAVLGGGWFLGIEWNGFQVFNVSSLFFFSLGCYVAFHRNVFSRLLNALIGNKIARIGFVVMLFVMIILSVYTTVIIRNRIMAALVYRMIILIGGLFLWCCYDTIIKPWLIKFRAYFSLSFFIYAFHVIATGLFIKLSVKLGGEHIRYSWSGIIAVVGGVLSSVCLGALLKTKAKNINWLLTGGRI